MRAVLDDSANEISCVPNAIADLRNLQWLSLHRMSSPLLLLNMKNKENKIRQVPRAIAQLNGLGLLYLSGTNAKSRFSFSLLIFQTIRS